MSMRILIYSPNYRPELTGIGKYNGELAAWLAARGMEVRVVSAPPYYPQWQVGENYSAFAYSKETVDGVVVYRCPIWVPAKPSGIKRILHLASFAVSSFPVLLGQIFWRPEVVFVVEPPLFCSPAALLAARLCGAIPWLHVQDFEVDAAFDLGILPAASLRRLVLAIETFLMRRFCRVSTISRKMMEKLAEKGVASQKSLLFSNWVDTRAIYPMATSPMRRELGIGDDEIVCLYSGNIGQKQGIEVLLDAARLLAAERGIRFLLCGSGAAREALFDSARDLENVTWLPLQPADKLNELLNLAEIHLLPQRADAADLVMPSKLGGMLASGRPIVATAKIGSEVAGVVANCGRVVEPGDSRQLAEAILELAADGRLRQSLGAEGRALAISLLEQDAVLGRFAESLLQLSSRSNRTG